MAGAEISGAPRPPLFPPSAPRRQRGGENSPQSCIRRKAGMAFAAPAGPPSLQLLQQPRNRVGLRRGPPGKAGLGWASQGLAGEGSPVPELQAGKSLWRPAPGAPARGGERRRRAARATARHGPGKPRWHPAGSLQDQLKQPALCNAGGRHANVKHAVANGTESLHPAGCRPLFLPPSSPSPPSQPPISGDPKTDTSDGGEGGARWAGIGPPVSAEDASQP